MAELIYRHRFKLSVGEAGQPGADNALLYAQAVSLSEDDISITYYLCREFVKFLTDHPLLDHLLISLSRMDGTPLVDLVLSELELVDDGFGKLEMDHTRTDLPVLVAKFSYNRRQIAVPAKK